MVGAAFAHPVDWGRKWVVFLGLSVCANAFFLSLVQFNAQIEPVINVPVMKIQLMSLARPAMSTPTTAKAEPVLAPPPPTPVRVQPVVTKAFAPKKVAVVPKTPQPKAEPVVEAKIQPVPLPKVRPVATKIKPLEAKTHRPIDVSKVVPEAVEKAPEKVVIEKAVAKPEAKPTPRPKTVASLPATVEDKGKDNSTVIHEARYRQQVPPSYPRRALDLGQQGTVTLHAEVLPSGAPRELKIAKSSGHRLLDMAALAAVKKWKFEPTSVDGNAVVSWVRVPVNFVIQ
jgi:protein TonB